MQRACAAPGAASTPPSLWSRPMLGSAMPRSLLKMPGPSRARYYEHKTTTSARKARRSVKRARVLLRRACKHQTFSGDCRCAAVCRRAWATGAAYRGRRAELRRLICVHELHVDATCSCEQARHAQTVSAAGSAGLSRRGGRVRLRVSWQGQGCREGLRRCCHACQAAKDTLGNGRMIFFDFRASI